MCLELEDIFKVPIIPERIFQMPFIFTREEKADLHNYNNNVVLYDYFMSVKEHNNTLIENCYYEENTELCNKVCHKY
jgi:hypothetical protein